MYCRQARSETALNPAALQLCHRWDTTSLTESPSFSAEPSPDGPSPTCEALLQAHEQQAAAAPLPRRDRALQQQQQHEGALQQARQGAQQLLQEMQDGKALQEDAEQQQQLPPLGKPRGAQTMPYTACNKLACLGVGLCMCACAAPHHAVLCCALRASLLCLAVYPACPVAVCALCPRCHPLLCCVVLCRR